MEIKNRRTKRGYKEIILKMAYIFPKGLRSSTLEERKEYYNTKFPLRKAMSWVGKKHFIVIRIGFKTKIYRKEFEKDKNDLIYLDDTKPSEIRKKILYYLPESIYYDRNVYTDGWEDGTVKEQELCFDLDPENITCEKCGSLTYKIEHNQTFSFCEKCFKQTREETIELYNYLKRKFKKIEVIYSGRGFHIHIKDRKAYRLTEKEREKLSKEILKRGINIDEWVSNGEMSLIRLPYTLNGLVNRIAKPVKINELKKLKLTSS